MKNGLTNFLSKVKGRSSFISYNEDETKQYLVLPLLQKLDWEIFNDDEVVPEYSVKATRVDYSLQLNNRNLVFIEVKKSGVKLEKHQEQLLNYSFKELLNYSFKEGVKLAILTNGKTWWLYLPLREGSWEERKFYSIDIEQQDLNEIRRKFEIFLSKKNIKSGQAVKNAENIFDSKIKNIAIKTALPEAWNKIISEPDEFLIELLKDKVENLSGYVPNAGNLEGFFENNVKQLNIVKNRDKSTSRKVVSNSKSKSKRVKHSEEKITEAELVDNIVQVLNDLGGKADKQIVEKEIYKINRDIFENDWYQGFVSHGIPRWKHNIAWAKEAAKHKGLVKPPQQSGRGTWELTNKAKKN
jgi:predicted type IV restriction endonuclease